MTSKFLGVFMATWRVQGVERGVVLTLILKKVLSTRTRRIRRDGFYSPFSFPVLLDTGFKRLHPGRFRGKLSVGARNIANGPVRYVTSNCISHITILRKKCKRTVCIARPGKLASICKRIVSFTGGVRTCMHRCRCTRRAFIYSLGFRPKRFPIGGKSVVTLDNGRKTSTKPRLRLRLQHARAKRCVSPVPCFGRLLGSDGTPMNDLVNVCPVRKGKIIGKSDRGGLLTVNGLGRPMRT